MTKVFTNYDEANAYIRTFNSEGIIIAFEPDCIAVFSAGSRAFDLAVTIYWAGQGPKAVKVAIGWVAVGFDNTDQANKVELELAAINDKVWANYLAYAASEYSEPDYAHAKIDYDAWLIANGLPVLTGAAEDYQNMLSGWLLGD